MGHCTRRLEGFGSEFGGEEVHGDFGGVAAVCGSFSVACFLGHVAFFVFAAISILVPDLVTNVARFLGTSPVDWFAQYPLTSIILIVAWQWLPFATLILLTSLQSLDTEQMEAAEMDGAGAVSRFIHLTLPHMARAITVVVLIQTIFLLGIYAEILVTTNGGPGNASTNLTYLIYRAARLNFDIGGAAAGGIIAVILANIVAIFLMRAVGKNLD